MNHTEDFEFSDLDDDNLFDIKPANQNESKIIEFRNETKEDEPKTEVTKPIENEIKTRRVLANGNYECNHACKDKQRCRDLCCREGLPPKTSGGNKTPQTENSKPVNSNTQQNPTETEDNSAKPEPTPISAKRHFKIRKNKATLKRTLFDDSDPEVVASPVEIPQSTTKPKKKTKSTIFSIDGSDHYENEETVHELNTIQNVDALAATSGKTSQLETKSKLAATSLSNSSELFLIEIPKTPIESLPSLSNANNAIADCNKSENEEVKVYNKELLQNLLGLDVDIDL